MKEMKLRQKYVGNGRFLQWSTLLYSISCTVTRFGWVSAKLGTCTVMSINETVVDGAIAKFSYNSYETDYSVRRAAIFSY